MKFVSTGLDGAWLIIPEPFADQRGFFMRTLCVREWAEHGLESNFVQHSTSLSRTPGTIRGMHFQEWPLETKVVRCISGAIHDVIIDLRAGSPTFGQHKEFELSGENRHQLYVPAGFAHGWQAVSGDAEVSYLISEFYVPDASRGFRYDDPYFGISWPLKPTVLSEKDRTWPDFDGTGLASTLPDGVTDPAGGH